MAMMLLLPATPECYAARTLVTLIILLPCLFYLEHHHGVIHRNSTFKPELVWGIIVGLLVLAIWVWPEQFGWYRKWCIYGDGGTAAVDESEMVYKIVRLLGSAFVISIAEELFFRRWLMRFAGFWLMVALFAVEHDRWLVGAIAGMLYGWLALRKGLLSAIIAHVTTNLALGLYVLETGNWQFW
jgi:CAAX prenyl protease-like protein